VKALACTCSTTAAVSLERFSCQPFVTWNLAEPVSLQRISVGGQAINLRINGATPDNAVCLSN
jgi:hypothetical protein